MEDFTAEDKSELSVKLGDCIVVMAKDPSGIGNWNVTSFQP